MFILRIGHSIAIGTQLPRHSFATQWLWVTIIQKFSPCTNALSLRLSSKFFECQLYILYYVYYGFVVGKEKGLAFFSKFLLVIRVVKMSCKLLLIFLSFVCSPLQLSLLTMMSPTQITLNCFISVKVFHDKCTWG